MLRLTPAGDPDADRLRRLTAARDTLTAAFAERFGVRPHPDYTPHVTLGYLANEEAAAGAAAFISRWNRDRLPELDGRTLRFERIRPSLFTDMASFGRDPAFPRFSRLPPTAE